MRAADDGRPALDGREFPTCARQLRESFPPQPVHFGGEPFAELRECARIKEPLTHRAEHPRLDVLPLDAPKIGAGTARPRVEAR